MPEKKNRKDNDSERERPHGPRPFWSGIIAFGLVSLPVSLFAVTGSSKASLRMIAADGEPLARRYFCPREERALEVEEIVRGYEVEKDRFVVLSDDELDAIAPEKSQEIDLRRFVPAGDIDPMYFERAYFLAPDEGAIKPYRLLAQSMEDTGRAGIATCVIHGKEYLLAILSAHGILRAEILRFADELRSPADVGLPKTAKPDTAAITQIEKAIQALSRKKPDSKLLIDERVTRILKRVSEKLKTGEDVIHEPEDAESEDSPTGNEPIDLMAVLKERLQQKPDGSKPSRKAGAPSAKKTQATKTGTKQTKPSRDDLYAQAQRLNIAGRSKMTKSELAEAIGTA